MADVEAEERKVLSDILAKLERIEAKLDEMNYPPEEAIRENFIRKVEEAEKGIEEGGYRKLSLNEFKKKFSP